MVNGRSLSISQCSIAADGSKLPSIVAGVGFMRRSICCATAAFELLVLSAVAVRDSRPMFASGDSSFEPLLLFLSWLLIDHTI